VVFLNCRITDDHGYDKIEHAHFVDDRLESGQGRVYIRDRYINSGKNGTVYACHLEGDRSRRLLAVKFLHVLTSQRLARFDFECAVLSELTHIHVLPLIDAGEVDTTLRQRSVPFLITELMDGNLEGLVKHKGPISPDEAIRIGMQMCDGFAYIHQQGIIHRDVKPGNFLLKDGNIVIGDFGLARTWTDEGAARFYREDITNEGEIVGPQSFMSPELFRYARNKRYPVDHRSDLYQVGAVLWYALTGFPLAGIPDARDDPSTGRLFPVLEKCLRMRPDERYATADELKAALGAI
jgi:serine/threonine protein kinase